MSLRSKLVCQDKSSSQVMGFEFKIWTRTRLVDTLVEVIIFLKVLSCWQQQAVGNQILVTVMR